MQFLGKRLGWHLSSDELKKKKYLLSLAEIKKNIGTKGKNDMIMCGDNRVGIIGIPTYM